MEEKGQKALGFQEPPKHRSPLVCWQCFSLFSFRKTPMCLSEESYYGSGAQSYLYAFLFDRIIQK